MTHVTCRLTTKNRDQLRNPTLGSRVWATLPLYIATADCCCCRCQPMVQLAERLHNFPGDIIESELFVCFRVVLMKERQGETDDYR